MALKKFTIDVRKEDLDSGERENPRFCAVARAVRRTTGCGGAYVTSFRIRVGKDDATAEDSPGALTSATVADWIDDFDRGFAVKPITFEIELDADACKPSNDASDTA